MNLITEEIQQLQLRILELEKEQKKKDEIDKKTSIDHNFNVINDVLEKKKTFINNNYYSKPRSITGVNYSKDIIIHLEAIYNILKIVDKRLKKLEEK